MMPETEDLGKNQNIPVREFYTLREVAVILRVSERTMRELLQSGEVHGHKLRGQWRIPHAEIERLRAAGEGRTTAPVDDPPHDFPSAPYGDYA